MIHPYDPSVLAEHDNSAATLDITFNNCLDRRDKFAAGARHKKVLEPD